MKKLAILSIILLSSCYQQDEEINPSNERRCITGINSKGERVFIRCATMEQFMAGSNVNAGGTANFANFKGHKWEGCERCKN